MALALLPKTARADTIINVDLSLGDIEISGLPNGVVAVKQGGGTLGSGALSDTEIAITTSSASGSGNVVNVSISNTSGTPVKITLDNVNIAAVGKNALKLTVNLDSAPHVLLTLKGTNTLTSDASAAVYVPVGAFLTIQGGGALKAIGGNSGAGIGGSNTDQKDCGSVTIKSGTVRASGGGGGGAGIGGSGTGSSGNGGNGGNITIVGGTVIASGGSTGAGIGGGGTHDSNTTGSGGAGGTATITGGTVYAWDGGSSTISKRGAGIGGGGCSASGSGSVGTSATVTIGSFAYEWVYNDHVAVLPYAREYSLGPFASGNMPGFVGIRQPLTISPASGAYGGAVSVTIRSSAANIDFIKYTLDGSDPKTSPSARTYSAPFAVTPSVQVKAYAEDHDPIPTGHQNNSAVVSAVYTLGGEVGEVDADVPKTGDDMPLALLIGLILLSGAGLAVSAASRRRTTKRP